MAFTATGRRSWDTFVRNERSDSCLRNTWNRARLFQLSIVNLSSVMRRGLQAILDLIIVPNPTIYISQMIWNVPVRLMEWRTIFTATQPQKGHSSQGRS